MADNKHANDEYENPGAVTAAAPPPPEIFPEQIEEEKQAAKDNAEQASPREQDSSRQRAQARQGQKP